LAALQLAEADDAEARLSQAERLTAAGAMMKARDFYAKAEVAFRERGDVRNELFAKFGRLRKDVESASYAAVRDEIDEDLAKEVVQRDPQLRLRALAVRGVINLNLNTRAAHADW